MKFTIAFLAAVAMSSIAVNAFGGDLPRYKLEPGEVVNFNVSSRIVSTDGSPSGTDGRICVEVAAAEKDGWRVVYFQTDDYWQGGRPTPSTKPATAGDMGIALLHADGRLENATDTYEDAAGFLPPLPSSEMQVTSGYSVDELFGGRSLATVTSHSGSTWVLSVREDSIENVIYLSTHVAEVAFDADRGLPVRIDSTYSQDYGFHEKGTGSIRLTSVEQKGGTWARQLAQDLAAFSSATTPIESADESTAETKKRSIDAITLALKSIKTPEVAAKLDERLQRLQRPADTLGEQSARQAALMNQPMPDWTLNKVGGGKLSLHDLHGKVVLIDFWYRGCGWCIRAMPQIKQLANDYNGKDVVVVGMNVDANEKDAAFVIDKLGLPYATVKTTYADAAKLGVGGYPTLIIVDRNGIIRKFDIGYSPMLRKTLSAKIDSLVRQ